MGVVDGALNTTEAHLPGYVKEYIRRQVEQARNKLEDYGNRWVGVLRILDTAST